MKSHPADQPITASCQAHTARLHRRQLLRTAAAAGAAAAAQATAAATKTTAATTAAADPPPSTPLQIIDTNVSLFRWPFRQLPLHTTTQLSQRLKKLGISQAIAGSFEGLFHRDLSDVNQRLASACRDHDHFIPVGSINPSLPGWEEDLQLCREQLTFRGIRLHPGVHGYSLEHTGFRRLLELAADAGMFVQVVTTVEDRRTQPQNFRTSDVNLQPLRNACRGLTTLRLQVLNARPAHALAAQLSEHAGICFDTARLEGTDAVPRLVQNLPPGRVLFGSHAPFLIPEAALIRVHESDMLTEPQLRSVFASGLQVLCGSPA